MIIDIHGHYTTAPTQLGAWRDLQIAFTEGRTDAPDPATLRISDDDIRETIEANQLKLMNERGSDVTVFSPRASFMAHHIGDLAVSETWARICNDLCARVSELYPERFLMGAMLPQSPGTDPATSVAELTRAVEELGAVTVNLNPDPSGGNWTSPPLTDRSWYPVYEKLVEYEIPAMVHVSTSCNPAFHTTGAHYLNADTTAFMQLLQGDLFGDFPELKLVIPHGGGAVPYHWGRFRGLAMALGKPVIEEHLLNNVFFDTCVYHQPGIDLLTKVVPTENILFASEMIGAVRDVDPRSGHYFDDTKRYVDATTNLNDAQRAQVFEDNARRVYPRLDRALIARGL
ncbi:4-oxalomesaconate hydratase (plasmid) [Pseudarthrobacter phenanthrenivorans Sphe3]|uniref:4-oxalomesaconate hydratase n=1 Tax=Pseudarthrobacter phenanthrenivorans (strain DSM 18606 / JCM 16027 / LMG 23796 / Sphe3) TaxID=930171 RepID=F0MCP4_PSEPM|nr:amidohydrolase family protein [Pseudarthrobacter phenanthrenivorans]ADX75300.1 4-oxalomesaconate hydratase [Pseudarthrobacter phenanthrenivorans Sphe3]